MAQLGCTRYSQSSLACVCLCVGQLGRQQKTSKFIATDKCPLSSSSPSPCSSSSPSSRDGHYSGPSGRIRHPQGLQPAEADGKTYHLRSVEGLDGEPYVLSWFVSSICNIEIKMTSRNLKWPNMDVASKHEPEVRHQKQ